MGSSRLRPGRVGDRLDCDGVPDCRKHIFLWGRERSRARTVAIEVGDVRDGVTEGIRRLTAMGGGHMVQSAIVEPRALTLCPHAPNM
jgi:hypothetical protein